MKRVLLLAIAFCCVPLVGNAQDAYQFDGVFPDSTTLLRSAHGIAVDADGKVWVQPYYTSEPDQYDRPNIRNAVYVFNEDGTQTDFSPIMEADLGTETIGLGLGTGLATDHEGNVIVSIHGFKETVDDTIRHNATRAFIIRLDRNTGNVLAHREVTIIRDAPAIHAPNRVGVDEMGNIFVSFVFGGSPLLIIDPDMGTEIARIDDVGPGFARTLTVSADGTRIYDVRFAGAPIRIFESEEGVFGEYSLADTTWGEDFNPGASSRDPSTGHIWVSSDGGGNDPSVAEGVNPRMFHLLHWETGEVLASFEWNYQPGEAFRPQRSVAASPDGRYVYVGTFAIGVPAVQRFELGPVNIEQDSPEIPAGYALEQNYPNPFNPSTTFSFQMAEAGHVHLAVFDVLGREVEVLANEFMPAGSYSATFEASPSLPSGTYFYVLEANGHRMTQKMVLLK